MRHRERHPRPSEGHPRDAERGPCAHLLDTARSVVLVVLRVGLKIGCVIRRR